MRFKVAIILAALLVLLTACAPNQGKSDSMVVDQIEETVRDSFETKDSGTISVNAGGQRIPEQNLLDNDENEVTDSRNNQNSSTDESEVNREQSGELEYCVAIDPGHQLKGNSAQEPIGPGAFETKAKVTGGTFGRWTGIAEHELTLQVSLMLRDELKQRGYRVVMTRTAEDVDVSNVERAQIAAAQNADIFVRIHANGSDDSSTSGALAICMTKNNPYCSELYEDSRRLSDDILDCMVAETGAKKRSVWETDTMSGINWATMPVSIVEMGFMTNEQEDRLMASDEYRKKLAIGIANGIDSYFGANGLKYKPLDESSSLADAADIQEILDDFVYSKEERWDVRFESLNENAVAAVQVNSPSEHGFTSASIIKLFIMGAIYDEIEAGNISREDVLPEITTMIQNSNNEAANSLTKRLGSGDAEIGMERVNHFADSIGCGDTRLNRLMMDFNGKENYTTAKDCATLLRLIYEGGCVSPKWSREMLTIMKGQIDHSRIHRYLPKTVVVADKPGSLYERSNGDVGIVFCSGGDYIICMICNDFSNADIVKEEMASLSKRIYESYINA